MIQVLAVAILKIHHHAGLMQQSPERRKPLPFFSSSVLCEPGRLRRMSALLIFCIHLEETQNALTLVQSYRLAQYSAHHLG